MKCVRLCSVTLRTCIVGRHHVIRSLDRQLLLLLLLLLVAGRRRRCGCGGGGGAGQLGGGTVDVGLVELAPQQPVQ